MFYPPLILAYHGIADVSPAHDPVRLFVGPEKLRGHIEKLKRRHYEFLHMAEFARRLDANGAPPKRTCVLTFDDGTEDHLTTLLPILSDLEVPGTVYVCRDLMGKPYPWADEATGIRLMTEEEVVEMSRDPLIEIGSHTIEHTVLEDATEQEAYDIMAASKDYLEELLGVDVPSFCYPRCRYSPGCLHAAERVGHTSAVTCENRGSWNPFELRRSMNLTPDGPVTFELKSRGVFYAIRDMPPARLARDLTRSFRHRSERTSA